MLTAFGREFLSAELRSGYVDRQLLLRVKPDFRVKAVKGLERGRPDSRIDAIVVREFCKGQFAAPVILPVVAIATKVVIYGLVLTLCLPIRLRVE